MSLLLSLVIAVVAVVVLWFVRRLHWVWRVNQIPGLEFTPFGLIGDIRFIRGLHQSHLLNPLQCLEPLIIAYRMIAGDTGLVRIWLGPIPHLIVTNADYAEAVLSSSEYITKGFQYKFIEPWLGQGLILSSGHKWRDRRKLLTPSFHVQLLGQFVSILNRNVSIFVSKLEQEVGKTGGLIDDISLSLRACTLDMLCESVMGVRMDAQSDPDSRYIRAVHNIGELILDRSMKPWFFLDTIFNLTANGRRHQELLQELHAFTDAAIKTRMKDIRLQDEEKSDRQTKRVEPFIDILIRKHMENPREFTARDMREEVDSFMVAGHDSTAWGVTWCTYLLGLNPECQKRLQEEVDNTYLDKEEDEDLTTDDLRKLVYTEAVVKEAQRLYSSAPLFMRSITSDTRIGDYDVPAGCQVMILANLLHHNQKYWSEPQKFKPERFLSGEKHHPYAFVPFSAGPRNCIAQKFAMMEEKALIASIFHKFNVTSLDHRDVIIPEVTGTRQSNIPIIVKIEARRTAVVS